MLPEPTRCCFPGCTKFGGHKHHVTYEPECTKPLCEDHHKEITHLNGIQSRKFNYVKLSTKFRWRIWFLWIRGELKPRRTKKAQEWTDGWDKAPANTSMVPSVPEIALEETVPLKKKRNKKKATASKRRTANKKTNSRRVR